MTRAKTLMLWTAKCACVSLLHTDLHTGRHVSNPGPSGHPATSRVRECTSLKQLVAPVQPEKFFDCTSALQQYKRKVSSAEKLSLNATGCSSMSGHLRAGLKSKASSIDLHVKMSTFPAEISMFTAGNKNKFDLF